MNWIQQVLNETDESEAPNSYFYWSSLAVLSAIVSRSVYIRKRKLYKLYPNLFVFLISKYSGLGKGFPVSVAQKLVSRLGHNRVIAGQASIEGIIKELGNAYTTKSGRIITTAEAFLISGEFGSFLLENPKLFTQLTDLYDSIYHDEWTKTLSSQEQNKLKDINLVGLFAANEVHFNEALPLHAKKGGFLGRVVCVYESKNRKLNAAIRKTDDPDINYEGLLEHLKEVAKLKGEFTITEEAITLYEKWYYVFYNIEKENIDDTGTAARAKDTILKVSMLLSLATRLDMIITEDHMSEAISQVMNTLSSTKTMIVGEGKQEHARKAKMILGIITNSPDHKITRKNLISRGFGEFDALDIDRVIETFEQGGLVKKWSSGKDLWYRVTEEAITLLTKFDKGDNNEK